MRKRFFGTSAFLVACSVITVSAQASSDSPATPGAKSNGELELPTNYAETWSHAGTVFVGGDLHNTYIKQEDLSYYKQHGKFRDGTVLVKEIRGSKSGTLTTGDARWGSDVKTWFVMMKDEKGRFQKSGLWGNGWGWSQYNGDNPQKQIATDYKKNCLVCHIPAKDTDWVYINKYPLLALDAKPVAENSQKVIIEGDAKTGKALFNSCQGCHSVQPSDNGVGPSLFGVYGRKAGSLSDYDYSGAMKNSTVIWNDSSLDKHLADPKGFIPGNYMGDSFPKGVVGAGDRASLIEYLKTLK